MTVKIIAGLVFVLVAMSGYYVWHQTTEEECYIGINKINWDCLDGYRKR